MRLVFCNAGYVLRRRWTTRKFCSNFWVTYILILDQDQEYFAEIKRPWIQRKEVDSKKREETFFVGSVGLGGKSSGTSASGDIYVCVYKKGKGNGWMGTTTAAGAELNCQEDVYARAIQEQEQERKGESGRQWPEAEAQAERPRQGR